MEIYGFATALRDFAMAIRSKKVSQAWIWFSLFLSMSAGIAVSTWQSDVSTRKERNWALKTVVVEETQIASHQDPARENQAIAASEPIEQQEYQLPASVEVVEPVSPPMPEGVAQEVIEPVAPVTQELLPPIAGIEPKADVALETETVALPVEVATEPKPEPIEPKTEIASSPIERDDQKAAPRALNEMPAIAPKTSAKKSCIATPAALLADLQLLDDAQNFSAFASRLTHQVKLLESHSSLDSMTLSATLERIELLRNEGLELVQDGAGDPALPTALRVVHGLSRRLEIWRSLIGRGPLMVSTGLAAEPIRATSERLREELTKSKNALAANWNRYLLLEELRAVQKGSHLSSQEFELMKRIAARARSASLTEEQKTFLSSGQPRDLLTVIDMYLLDAPTSQELLKLIEEYEVEPRQELANSIALALGRLSLSPAEDDAQLVKKLTQFYRAANVRVAIAESLINELIPTPEDANEPVNDQVMGASVTGRSNVSTRLKVQLVPDQTRWRVGLEAAGYVSSNTQAFKGPFTFFNQGWANYRAKTTVGLGREGFHMNTPTAEASSQTDLLDLQSDFDGIPLFGLLARSVARQQHAQKQLEAEWEVEGRMARRIEQKLDSELNTRIRQAEKEWTSRIAQPLEDLRLGPTPVAMETTTQRLIARYRIAGATQLAANTARPLAPSDSVLSVQLHASAINNFIEQLGLDGKTYKLEELFLHLTKAMGQANAEIPEDMPTNIHVRFADKDSLRLDIVNREALLTVRLAEIRQGKSKWKNVQVRGHFAPKVNGLHAELERTSYVELKGDGLRKLGGGQVVLRIAFTSVLSRVSNIPLMHPKLSTHPKMQNYEIRQFVLEDGWIGLALGPKVAHAEAKSREERTETARRPKTPVMDSILRR